MHWDGSVVQKQIKSLLYSRYYAEACNEWRGPSTRLSARATQKLRNGGKQVATVFDLTGPGIESRPPAPMS